MAKRKRLAPARDTATLPGPAEAPAPAPAPETAPETKSMFSLGVARTRIRSAAPIAGIARDAAQEAALQDMAETLRAAREAGRMVQALPLDAVEANHLVRDRLVADEAEMETLIQSIRARGQQTPVEVVALEDGRYGLISGWRRLTALRRLAAEDSARFATVQALLRQPECAAEAYRAMVEENEIRVGLSYYERARIVARAAAEGVYDSAPAALTGLFASASRPKRSKIGTFLKLHDALDDRLRFPTAISERLGLALARKLEAEPGFAAILRERLRKGAPATAEAETALLERAIAGKVETAPGPARETAPAAKPEGTGGAEITVTAGKGRITLAGPGVDAGLEAELRAWLTERLSGQG